MAQQQPSEIGTKQVKKDAEALLKNPVFRQITEDLDTQHYQRWAEQLKPAERDELWFKANAIRELLHMIKYLAEQQIRVESKH